MMNRVRRLLRFGFVGLEAALDRVFSPSWNPLHQLGALGFFFYWIVAVSGIYLYVFFDTGTVQAYQSVEQLTYRQWYVGGVMRSLHRYASDGMVVFMLLHLLREFSFDRYRGKRWFSWVTGAPVLWLVYASGITGYWLVWDKLAQYVAIATSEMLDWFPIFGEPIARNYLTPERLDDRFFTLLIFIHIALPLLLLFVLWLHLQRMSKPKINPPRGLAAGSFVMLIALSFIKPALSQGPADLNMVPVTVGLDWFYLGLYPLMESWSNGAVWGVAGAATLILAVLPWMPPMRRSKPAVVDLELCNGCGRCAEDCPFSAVVMAPRRDGRAYLQQAVVDPNLCLSCGICVGACPTSSPFRHAESLPNAIDLPSLTLTDMRARTRQAAAGLSGARRVLVFGCDHGANVKELAADGDLATVSLPCIAMLPPSFIDYVLSRDLADGVVITGCREEQCYHRLGVEWTTARLAGTRDPYLRQRIPRERFVEIWAGLEDQSRLKGEVAAFADGIGRLGPFVALPPEKAQS